MAARVEVREGAKRKSSLGQLTLSSECAHSGAVSPARNITVLGYIPRVQHFEGCVCFVGMGGPISGTSYLGTFLRRWPKIDPHVA